MGGGCTHAWCVRWWGLVSVVRILPGKVLMCVCVCVCVCACACVFLTCIWSLGLGFEPIFTPLRE